MCRENNEKGLHCAEKAKVIAEWYMKLCTKRLSREDIIIALILCREQTFRIPLYLYQVLTPVLAGFEHFDSGFQAHLGHRFQKQTFTVVIE